MSISSFTSDCGAAERASVLATACAERLRGPDAAPLVSVIIPVYNNWEATEECLASVLSCDPEIAIELIVVDDASTDETPGKLSRLSGVHVLRNRANVGFVHGCNRGAATARGQYLFFLNNDTLLRKDSIAALVRRIESDDDIGIVGSKLVYPDGKLQEAGAIIWSDAFAWNYGNADDADRPEYNFTREVDYVSGAALLVRADLFRELGGFDERYAPAYYEDVDLCFAARLHGMRVVYEPSSVVTHYEGLTAGRDVTAGMKRFYEINRPKFESKWQGVLRREHYAFSEANVRRAARRRGAEQPAVLLIGSTVSPDTSGSNRLRRLAAAFVRAGRRVVCLPHDLAGGGPEARRLQSTGVEVLMRTGGDARSAREHLAEALPTVDVAIIIGPELFRAYLRDIRAQRPIPVLYDATESVHSRWDAGDLDATCIRAADCTIVRTDAEAELFRTSGLGPVAIVPPTNDPDLDAALHMIDRLIAVVPAPQREADGTEVAAPRTPARSREMQMQFTGERFVPELRGPIYYEHMHRYAIARTMARGLDVLDIASGEGYGSAYLALVARSVVGVDIEETAVRHAAARYTEKSLSFRVGTCTDIPVADGSVDLVVSLETLEHIGEHEQFMREIVRVLRPEGKFIVSTPNKLAYTDASDVVNPFHVRELYFDEFRDLLRDWFPYCRIYGQRVVAGSAVHPLSGNASNARFISPSLYEETGLPSMPAPVYFLAVCSRSDSETELGEVNSIFLDPGDDLLDDMLPQRAAVTALSSDKDATESDRASAAHPNAPTHAAQSEGVSEEIASLLHDVRYASPKRLNRFGWRAFSQTDEDGMIEEIFRRIGTTSRRFLEIGVGNGVGNNTAYLLARGWSGTWIESDPDCCAAILRNCDTAIRDGRLALIGAAALPDGIDLLILDSGLAGEIDLLSLNLGSNDYHVLRRIKAVRPRLVVVKYDASYQPPVRRITRKFNASLSAYHDLMTKRGYVLVGCNLAGIHAFFVRADLARDRFATPLDAENHFEPPRLHLVPRPEGCVGPTTYGSQGV